MEAQYNRRKCETTVGHGRTCWWSLTPLFTNGEKALLHGHSFPPLTADKRGKSAQQVPPKKEKKVPETEGKWSYVRCSFFDRKAPLKPLGGEVKRAGAHLFPMHLPADEEEMSVISENRLSHIRRERRERKQRRKGGRTDQEN